jgi:hypothetical protein
VAPFSTQPEGKFDRPEPVHIGQKENLMDEKQCRTAKGDISGAITSTDENQYR